MKNVSLTLVQVNLKKETPEQATSKDIPKLYVTIFSWQKWHHQKTNSLNKPKLKDLIYFPGRKSEKWNQHFALATNLYALNTLL